MEERLWARWGFVCLLVLVILSLAGTGASGDASPEMVVPKRHAYAAMMYMGTPRDYEFYVATRVMMRSLSKLRVDADLVVIASVDVPMEWVQTMGGGGGGEWTKSEESRIGVGVGGFWRGGRAEVESWETRLGGWGQRWRVAG
ncbi:putative glucuronosyltransferase PGSIP8 [Platanthera guangdongensis]|uniref:Glucuronosyltransferase PGSIP8 n=1 Tax=Platanthera guangdongensis TaxID=2320717 RepID=A0ABR2LM53_9ASPA